MNEIKQLAQQKFNERLAEKIVDLQEEIIKCEDIIMKSIKEIKQLEAGELTFAK